ncbi:MAG: hypothetical protein Q9170_003369 [Blastenia crenularia]
MELLSKMSLRMIMTTIVFFISGRVIAYLSYIQSVRKNGCRVPPKYPHKDIIFGLDMIFEQFQAEKRGNIWKTERERFRKYGKTFEANSWGTRCVHTMDPANIQVILAQCFDSFGVEPMRLPISGAFIGKGVFTTDGPYWRYSRDLMKPIFARAQISDLSILEIHTNRMLDSIPSDRSTVDMQWLLKLMFLDHSTETLFGESSRTLVAKSSKSTENELLTTFNTALRGLGKRMLLGNIRLLFFWDRSFDLLVQRVHDVIDGYIDKAQARKVKLGTQPSPNSAPQRYVVLDELVSVLQSTQEIRSQIINIFLPARDATGIALSGVLFLMARHPRVWRKLRAEVLLIGDNPLTFEVLKSLQYMKYVLNESFRLLMPANHNIRVCLRECVLPAGGGPQGNSPIFIPQGTQVVVNFGAMQRDKDIWGEDANEFHPERWQDMKLGWHYIPFSGGPRVCPGQQLAFTESSYVLARLLQTFESIENRDPEIAYIEERRLTIESRNGVRIAFQSDRTSKPKRSEV